VILLSGGEAGASALCRKRLPIVIPPTFSLDIIGLIRQNRLKWGSDIACTESVRALSSLRILPMTTTTDSERHMDARLDEALRLWVSAHPEARLDQFVVIFEDADVIGPFDSGHQAIRAACESKPKALSHICRIGANQYGVERVQSNGDYRTL
jgi:hypothetical protein